MYRLVTICLNMHKYLAAIGLCEHCGGLVDITDYASDETMNADWLCGHCSKPLGHLSFGFDRATQGAQKVKWVGPNGTWVDSKPEEDFKLGNITILILPVSTLL